MTVTGHKTRQGPPRQVTAQYSLTLVGLPDDLPLVLEGEPLDRAQPLGERGQSGLRALARDGVQQSCRHGRQHRSPPSGPFRERRDG